MNLLDLARSALPPARTQTTLVSGTRPRVDAHTVAAPPQPPANLARAVVPYMLVDGKGGLLIDPDGITSAVRELDWRYGSRLDWAALLRSFEERERSADREAAALIRRLISETHRE